MTSADDEREWYYAEGGDQRGPFGRPEMERLVAEGVVGPETLVWAESMAGWVEMRLSELGQAAASSTGRSKPPPIVERPLAGSAERRRGARAEAASAIIGGPAPGLNFKEAMVSTLKAKYATFSGRASRSEYWYFVLFYFLANFATLAVDGLVFDEDLDFTPLSTILALGLFIPSLSVTVRRLHDTDRSARWLLLALAPFGAAIGLALLMPLMLAAGQSGTELPALVFTVVFLGSMLVAFLVLTVFMLLEGTPGPNRYG